MSMAVGILWACCLANHINWAALICCKYNIEKIDLYIRKYSIRGESRDYLISLDLAWTWFSFFLKYSVYKILTTGTTSFKILLLRRVISTSDLFFLLPRINLLRVLVICYIIVTIREIFSSSVMDTQSCVVTQCIAEISQRIAKDVF